MVKQVGKYELGRTLGEGTFGKVKYAVNTETKQAVAIKVLDKEKIQKQNMGNQIKREISIMKLVKHKYIVEMIEVLASKSKIFIVLELVTGGELFDKIVRDGRLSQEQALFYFGQLLEGVEYCHGLGVCHRDLKPENLLLDEHSNLKISDFGLSSLYVSETDTAASRTQLLHTTCGTPNYVAPEVLADQGYDGKKADVWSMGVILYVLLAGFLPFDEKTIVELFQKIQSADYVFPSHFSKEMKEVISLILVADPKTRISANELKRHPYLEALFKSSTLSSNGSSSNVNNEKSSAQLTYEAIEGKLKDLSIQDEKGNSNVIHDVEDDHPSQQWSVINRSLDHELGTLRKLNAFDLVNQCGGFGVDQLFSPHTFYHSKNNNTAPGSSSSTVAVADDKLDGITRFGKSSSSFSLGANGCYNFTSPMVPAINLILEVYNILISDEWTHELTLEESKFSGMIRATKNSPKGMIGVGINIYILCSGLSLLQIVRGKGDRLEWNKIYTELVEKKFASLIEKAKDGEAKKTSQSSS